MDLYEISMYWTCSVCTTDKKPVCVANGLLTKPGNCLPNDSTSNKMSSEAKYVWALCVPRILSKI